MISNEIKTLWLKSDQVPKLDRGQTGVAQVADLPHAAADVAGQVMGGPKAFVRSWSAGLFRERLLCVHACRWMSNHADQRIFRCHRSSLPAARSGDLTHLALVPYWHHACYC
jgi:hypothetical protein